MTALLRRNPSWFSFLCHATADPEYPLELIDTVETRRRRAGYSGSKGVLYIMSGSIWHQERKAEL